MLITISGTPGSGKTTVARLLAGQLGVPHVYAGDIYRAEAESRGLSLAELNALAERDHTIDRALDERMAAWARAGNVILEGRLAAFVANQEKVDALKVWLTASDQVRAERVAGREGAAVNEVLAENDARQRSDARRYLEIYGWDLDDTSLYDLILVSDDQTPEALAAAIETAAGARFPEAC
jgi:cytidylate kinase